MAAAQVLAIPELLENVLLYADIVQLFALQRVNRTFKDVIADSKPIRLRMLLEAAEGDDLASLQQFLARHELQQALWPFTIGQPDRNFCYYSFTLHLQCESVPSHGEDLCQTASWSRVHLGRVDRIYLECSRGYIIGEDQEVWARNITLGEIIDVANAVELEDHDSCEAKHGREYAVRSSPPTARPATPTVRPATPTTVQADAIVQEDTDDLIFFWELEDEVFKENEPLLIDL